MASNEKGKRETSHLRAYGNALSKDGEGMDLEGWLPGTRRGTNLLAPFAIGK
jgi:hypothetical protein